MIEHHDFADEEKWTDSKLVQYHNELVDELDIDLMPRMAQTALKQLVLVDFEIEMRVIDIVEEDCA